MNPEQLHSQVRGQLLPIAGGSGRHPGECPEGSIPARPLWRGGHSRGGCCAMKEEGNPTSVHRMVSSPKGWSPAACRADFLVLETQTAGCFETRPLHSQQSSG